MTEYHGVPISFGGGINSTAMIIMLVEQGWHGEIIFSDTGCEWPETYCYMDYFEKEWLAPRGLPVTVLKGMPWHRKSQGRSLIEYCEYGHVIPMMAVRWCTIGWKINPVEKYAGKTLIGIAADEAHRQKDRMCPLCDEGITRHGCIDIIKTAGLDVPQKSGCYICPFMRKAQWRELWSRHPELYARAEAIEANTPRTKKGHSRVTLDPSGKVTLAQLRDGFERQIDLPGFDMDDLLEYQPCTCGL